MESIRIQTAQNVQIEQPLAGVGDRLIAGLLDLIIVMIAAIVGSAVISSIDSSLGVWFIVLYNIVILAYYPISEIAFNGGSIGKNAMSLKVIKIDGSPYRVSDALLRWLIGFVEIFMTYGGLATLVVALNPKGQRLGDMAAGTTVIKKRNSMRQLQRNLASRPELPEDYEPTFQGLLSLTDQEIEICRKAIRIFRIRQDREPMEVGENYGRKALGNSERFTSHQIHGHY